MTDVFVIQRNWQTLIKPKLQPPDNMWAPVSIVINSALGFASYLVSAREHADSATVGM